MREKLGVESIYRLLRGPRDCYPQLTMALGERTERRGSDVSDKPMKPNVLTRSTSSPPQTSEAKSRPREPCPIPSNNPSSQYTLLEKLGTGSFGTVYKAMHKETKQIVAIKQIGGMIICSFP